jgi:aerobic-type carbon monoxide dehydrogenase small subunit (CoxS/CutS family)
MRLTVNGFEHDLRSPPLASLLHALREELQITGPKAGCEQGGCGACTVLVDDEPRRACLLPLAAVEGAAITTVEGLGTPDELSQVQAAFERHYAAQCGFCTPGFLIAATALVRSRPAASPEDVLAALAGHVCRCTGYIKIVDAVEAALRGEVSPEEVEPSYEPEEADVLIPGSPA